MIELRRNKDRLESIAMIVMVVGIILLIQPLSIAIFGFGFPVLLIGLVMFIIVSHF